MDRIESYCSNHGVASNIDFNSFTKLIQFLSEYHVIFSDGGSAKHKVFGKRLLGSAHVSQTKLPDTAKT
ncbi:conserved hypothetical protein [Ricinus communis]|uniref:Uncharacterized protein n=1 Tax=Ricinus communis TaxID=3988 RepID=B9T2N4_RICCO|nr:conserved hypothetical protein [Ricinus communis]